MKAIFYQACGDVRATHTLYPPTQLCLRATLTTCCCFCQSMRVMDKARFVRFMVRCPGMTAKRADHRVVEEAFVLACAKQVTLGAVAA